MTDQTSGPNGDQAPQAGITRTVLREIEAAMPDQFARLREALAAPCRLAEVAADLERKLVARGADAR
jgi:hypothetical protein